MTPTPAELARMKPNAKSDLILVGGTQIECVYYARLGRYIVTCEGDPKHWKTKKEAEDAAWRFKAQCVKASA